MPAFLGENPRFPRIDPIATKIVAVRTLEKRSQRYLDGVIANVGLGGFFLPSDEVFAEGTELTLEFERVEAGVRHTLRAKALVRWNKRFVGRGVGLEFFELEGAMRAPLAQLFAQ